MRYITKGDLLNLLGEDSTRLTDFFLYPEAYGLSEELVKKVKLTKQKFDWTNGLDLDSRDVKDLVFMLVALGIITTESSAILDKIIDSPELDSVVVTINALDDITVDNISGVIAKNDGYVVEASFLNTTKNTTTLETLWFDIIPSQELLNSTILTVVRRLRIARM